jgi:signal transduction histidine kinase
MRERVLIMGGRLLLESEPGEGTSLNVWVPVNEV